MLKEPALKITTMLNSGKKEGMGGIEALDTNKSPVKRRAQCRALSLMLNAPKRECMGCLKAPPEKNIPIEAHPWASDIKTVLKKTSLLLDNSPKSIKVMWVTLL